MSANSDTTLKLSNNSFEVTIDDLGRTIFVPGELYWKRKSGKLLKVMHAGDFFTQADIEKYSKVGNLILDPLTDKKYIDQGIEFFTNLRDSKLEKEKIELRTKILKWFDRIYWSGVEGGSILNLMHVCKEVVLRIAPSEFKKIFAGSTDLSARSFITASFSPIVCLACGILDFRNISDIFHLILLSDVSYAEFPLSPLRRQILNQDLNGKVDPAAHNENELTFFYDHVEKSIQINEEKHGQYFYHQRQIKRIFAHHERVNGTGYPKKYKDYEISRIEEIIILLSSMLPFDEYSFSLHDGDSILKEHILSPNNVVGFSLAHGLKKMLLTEFDKLPDSIEEVAA